MCAAVRERRRMFVHYPHPISQKQKMDKRVLFYFMGVDAVRQPPWGGCRTGGCLGFLEDKKTNIQLIKSRNPGHHYQKSKRQLWEKLCPPTFLIQKKRCFIQIKICFHHPSPRYFDLLFDWGNAVF
jgi:hypothetical protein